MNMTTYDKKPENRTGFDKSPIRLIAVIAFSIFISETLVMAIFILLPPFSSGLIEALVDSTALVILLSPLLYYFMFRPLMLHINERRQTEDALLKVKNELEDKVIERTTEFKLANEQLTAWAKELEQHNRENKLLSEMVDFLQTSLNAEESYPIITQFASKLIPDDSGGLYIFRASRNLLELTTAWGDVLPEEPGFHPDDCWALRRGQPHIVIDNSIGVRCQHIKNKLLPYICMPMMAHGETLGVLHLVLNSYDAAKGIEHLEAKQRLLSGMAEHIGLAVANLKLRETLRSLSIRDPLTGLFNRRYMEESLEREQYRSERNNIPLGIIMIDIDHFKRFNDTFGHDAGDTILRAFGALLQKMIRGFDIACRYGGEEFCVILSGAPLEVTLKRAEQLREAVKQMQVQYEQPLSAITLSLGVAVFPQHGSTAQDVLQAADAALYRAKKEGRDRVCTAEEIILSDTKDRLAE